MFCGLGGWTEGLLGEGWQVVGFDIERHRYGDAKYPAQLVLQDVLTLHGGQFKDAALIVASPPCQRYSWMAMPWSKAKEKARWYRDHAKNDEPEGPHAAERQRELNALFDACFRIQREAIEAAGHFIPLVVENVRGACPWVGRSRWNFGSYHLWGDVPALMPMTAKRSNLKAEIIEVRHPGCVNLHQAQARRQDGTKQHKSGRAWFADPDTISGSTSSKSSARKAASAAIAKIPFPLAQHIARVWYPRST